MQARISKYIAKGFECAVPGVRREAFVTPTNQRRVEYDTYDYSSKGIGLLFDAEADLLQSRAYSGYEEEYIEKITGRLKIVESATIAAKLVHKLGQGRDDPPQYKESCYGLVVCGTGTYGFIRNPFRRLVAVRLGDARRDMPLNMTFTATFVGFTDAGRFQPSEAYLEQLYDKEKLAEVAKAEVAARAEAAVGMDLDLDVDSGGDDDNEGGGDDWLEGIFDDEQDDINEEPSEEDATAEDIADEAVPPKEAAPEAAV